TFETLSGTVRLIDLMPVMREEEKRRRLTPFRQILRRIEGISGEVPIEVQFSPRPGYAQTPADLAQRGDCICCEQLPMVMNLRSDARTGELDAAQTNALPEKIGGIRNWDYRYCWLRDASFTVAALDDCGFTTEGGAFVHWILYATRLTHPRLQILYDVFGEPRIREKTLKFEGYRGSAPVRAGNGARNQLQLDVYVDFLGAVEEHHEKEVHQELSRDVK